MFVNPGKRRQRDPEKIKGRDQSVGKCQAQRPDCFIATGACRNSLFAVHHAPKAVKPAKKFYIFHQRHVWKSPNINKSRSPTEKAMIAASHPKQEPRVMRKAVR